MRRVFVWLFLCLATSPGGTLADTLDTHEVVLDSSGKLLSWVTPADEAYDRVMFLSWDLLKNRIPVDPNNGLEVTYTHSEYDPSSLAGSGWPNNPAGKNAMLADSAAMYYAYSGDRAVVDLVVGLLDHQLAHGTTPPSYAWANVPWSTAQAGSASYGNDGVVEGVGVLEPDKVGELGFHGYLRFYELTGDARYRDAAIACGDALALHVRDGNATQSPWPFRVVAQSGAVREEYCADVIAPIRLFDELIRLNLGDVAAYQVARQKAWAWLMAFPMQNNVWANYFEDVGVQGDLSNVNQYNPGQTARYLLEHPEADPDGLAKATGLVAWIESTFGGSGNGEDGVQYGARTISEQVVYGFKMASHTSRFAAINALLAEATGGQAFKEKAFRSLNWSTYMCRANGVVIEGPSEFANNPQCWFTDGHGDYIRHFMLAIGAVPEWAPAGENHLLRSTSVVRSITYGPTGIDYETFDSTATEVLRLSSAPLNVLAGGQPLPQRMDLTQPGWTFDGFSGVLRLRHDSSTQIQVLYDNSNQPPSVSITSPASGAIFAYPATVTVDASATDTDGSVAGVEFYSGFTKIGEDATVPYSVTLTDLSPGRYELTATALDNGGARTTSAPVDITVNSPTGGNIIGSTSEGTTTDYLWDGGPFINACRFPAPSDLTLNALFAKVEGIPGKYKCAIYSDNNGNPDRLLRETAEVSNPVSGWQTFPLAAPVAVTSGSSYWLAIWSDDPGARVYAQNGGTIRWGRYDYGAWPDPIDASGSSDYTYSIYAVGAPSSNYQCDASPAIVCHVTDAPGASLLRLQNGSPDDRDRLIWKWLKGDAMPQADLGNPATTTDYALCLYDQAGLLAQAVVPHGGVCNGRPCWDERATGWKYRDGALTADGVAQIAARSNLAPGRAKIIVKARGVPLDMPDLPIPAANLPLTVQLHASNGQCWSTTFATPRRNDNERFQAKDQ